MSIGTSSQCGCSSYVPSRLSSARCSRCQHKLSEHQAACVRSRTACSNSAVANLDSQSTQRPSRLSSDRTISPVPHLKSSFDANRPCKPIQGNSSLDIHISAAHFRPTELQAIKDHILAPQPTKSTECESSSQRSFKPKTLDSRPLPSSSRRQASYSGPFQSFTKSPEPAVIPAKSSANYHSHMEQLMIEQILTNQQKLVTRKRSKSPYSLSVSQSRSQTPLQRSKSPAKKLSISRISRCSARQSPLPQSPVPEEDRKSHQQRVYSEYFPGASFDSAPTSYQATARVFDPEDDRLLLHFTGIGHTNTLNSLCLYDQAFLLTASSDYTIGKWRLPRGNLDPYKPDLHAVRFGSQCEAERRWRGHAGKVWTVTALSNGRFCSAGEDGLVRIWKDKQETGDNEVIRPCIGPIKYSAKLESGELIISSSKRIQAFDVTSRKQIVSFPLAHTLPILSLTPTSSVSIASTSEDMTVKLWDVRSGTCTSSLTGHTDSVNCLSIMSEFSILTGSDDCSIRFWDLRKTKEVDRLEGGEDKVRAVSAYSEGLIFSCGESLGVWERGICHKVHAGPIRCLLSLPSARSLVTAGSDYQFRVWRVLSQPL
jgi:WD40 repeat protein